MARKTDEFSRAIEWWIWQLPGVGARTMEKLEACLDGEFLRLTDESPDSLEALLREASVAEKVRAKIDADSLDGAWDAWRTEHAELPECSQIIHTGDAGFPTRLEALECPPRFLYVRGRIDALDRPRTLSVVGSRSARVDGIRQAREIAEAAAVSGFVIVSGGAIGVDAAAHRGANNAEAETVVVLPGGVGKPRPQKNSRVFRDALERGCLVSEYPLGSAVRKYHFHRRNRLIAALGDCLLVVRAGRQSGTMITARAAAELGRPILTMAGGMKDSRFAGCVDLLAAGASCVRGPEDVARKLNGLSDKEARVDISLIERPASGTKDREKTSAGQSEEPIDHELRARLGDAARSILSMLEEAVPSEHVHVDDLRRKWGDGAASLESALLELELVGVVAKVPGKNAYTVVK